jgi:hypothetical protein
MIFKPPVAAGPGGDTWDQKTLDWLGKTKMLSLRTTHIERRFKGGPGAPWGRNRSGNPEVVVSGYLYGAPQHVHFQIEFEDDLASYGEGWLTYYLDQEYPTGRINIPYLQIRLQDADQSIRTGFVEAMRDAVMAGGNQAEARAFIKPGDKWDGIEGGHTRTLVIEGIIVWAYTRAPSLPTWTLPMGEFEFDGFPRPDQLRSKPKE